MEGVESGDRLGGGVGWDKGDRLCPVDKIMDTPLLLYYDFGYKCLYQSAAIE